MQRTDWMVYLLKKKIWLWFKRIIIINVGGQGQECDHQLFRLGVVCSARNDTNSAERLTAEAKRKTGSEPRLWHNAGGNSDIIRTLNVPKHLKCFLDNYRPLIIEWSLSIQVSKNEIRQKGARHQENTDPGGKSMSDRLIQGNGSSNKREIYLGTVESQYIFYEQGSLGHYNCPHWG